MSQNNKKNKSPKQKAIAANPASHVEVPRRHGPSPMPSSPDRGPPAFSNMNLDLRNAALFEESGKDEQETLSDKKVEIESQHVTPSKVENKEIYTSKKVQEDSNLLSLVKFEKNSTENSIDEHRCLDRGESLHEQITAAVHVATKEVQDQMSNEIARRIGGIDNVLIKITDNINTLSEKLEIRNRKESLSDKDDSFDVRFIGITKDAKQTKVKTAKPPNVQGKDTLKGTRSVDPSVKSFYSQITRSVHQSD